MAIPLSLQLFDAFLGSGEGIHSIILPDIFSSGGSVNVYMDKYARVKRILGYASQGSAYTTNGGGNLARMRGAFSYVTTAGGTSTRRLVAVWDDGTDEWELAYSTDEGTSWTLLSDLGATSVGAIPDFEQFGDLLIITNGKIAPRVLDGTTLSTIGSAQLAAPALAVAGSGYLTGQYQYKIVPRKDDATRKAASDTSLVISVEDDSITVTWAADADLTVDGYEVYRTSGTGGLFWFVDFVEGRTTVTYTDNIDDFTILENRALEEHGDPPPNAYHVATHKQIVWYLGTDDDPQTAFFADTGRYDSVGANSRIDLTDAQSQGDRIRGGVGGYEGMLVVFQEHSIWTISGTGAVIGNIRDYSRTRTNAEAGTVARRSIVRVPAGATYFDQEGNKQRTTGVTLAYFTPHGDIRLFDGDNDVVLSFPVKDTLSEFNYANRHKIHALKDRSRSEITWIFPRGANSECSSAVTWNYRWGVMYERDWPFGAAVEVDASATAKTYLAGAAALTGKTFELWTGDTFDGIAFRAQWMTKTFYGRNEQGQPIPAMEKRWRWIELLLQVEQNTDLEVEWLEGTAPDEGDSVGSKTVTPSTSPLLSAEGNPVLSADGNPILVAGTSVQSKIKLQNGNGQFFHDTGVRLRIGDITSQGSWALEGYTLAFQILPGLARVRGV